MMETLYLCSKRSQQSANRIYNQKSTNVFVNGSEVTWRYDKLVNVTMVFQPFLASTTKEEVVDDDVDREVDQYDACEGCDRIMVVSWTL